MTTKVIASSLMNSLVIAEHENKYYWVIYDWEDKLDDYRNYDEIPKSLYDELIELHKKVINTSL
jgi:hypothetical protein